MTDLRKQADTEVLPVCVPDTVCQYCPHLTSENTCGEKDNRIAAKDGRLFEILELVPGRSYTYRQLQKYVLRKFTEAHFDEICGDCGWNASGLCNYVTLVQKLQ